MITLDLQLTLAEIVAIIALLLPKMVMAQRETWQIKKDGAGYAPIKEHGFFYAYRKGAVSIRAYTSSMVGYFQGRLPFLPRLKPGFYPAARGLRPLPVVISHSKRVIT